MSRKQSAGGRIQWTRMLKKLSPYTVQKGVRYLKHYGPKEFWIRLHERFEPEEVPYGPWYAAYIPDKETLEEQKKHKFSDPLLISIAVPAYQTPVKFLKQMIESLIAQTYAQWELCIANASPDDEEMQRVLADYSARDPRVKFCNLRENMGIAENTNRAFAMAGGEFIGLLDHDDLLAPNALYEVASLILQYEDADAVYTDEDKFSDSVNGRFEPAFKPDFNLDLLRSNNYICHLFVTKREIAEEVGGFHSEFDGSQDYDFIFRCTEKAKGVYHIPKVLYYWRSHPDSVAENPESKTYAYEAGKHAIEAHLARCKVEAEVSRLPYWGLYRVDYKPDKDAKISVIVRKEASGGEGSVSKSRGNGPEMIELDASGNRADLNEKIKERAKGDYYLFLNPSLQALPEESLAQLVKQASRRDAGAVGARIYDNESRIAQAGYVMGMDGLAGSVLKGTIRDTIGYCAKAILQQDYAMVSPAAYMVSKEQFFAVGGFDRQLSYPLADLDLQLRLGQKGLLCIYEPAAELSFKTGEEKKSGAEAEREEAYFKAKWKELLEKPDPFYNVNFSLEDSDFSLRKC